MVINWVKGIGGYCYKPLTCQMIFYPSSIPCALSVHKATKLQHFSLDSFPIVLLLRGLMVWLDEVNSLPKKHEPAA